MGRYSHGKAKTKVNVGIDISYLISALCNVSGISVEDDIECELNGDRIDLTIPIEVEVKSYYDPGKRWMSNGDPGYPPEYDVDPQYDWRAFEDIAKTESIPISLEMDEDFEVTDEEPEW